MSKNKKDRFASWRKGGAHVARAGSNISIKAQKAEKAKIKADYARTEFPEAQDKIVPKPSDSEEVPKTFQFDGSLINDIWSAMYPDDPPPPPAAEKTPLQDTAYRPAHLRKPAHLKEKNPEPKPEPEHLTDNSPTKKLPELEPIDPALEPTLIMPSRNFSAAIASSRKRGQNETFKQPEPLLLPPLPDEEPEADAPETQNKRSGKRRVKLAVGLVSLMFLISFGAFFAAEARKGSKEQLENPIAVAYTGPIETFVEGSGLTAASSREQLGEDTKGIIDKVLVEVGDEVVKDEVLIAMNPTDLRIELANAEQELANAQMEVTSAQMDVRNAQDAVISANSKLAGMEVSAPFTGRLIAVEDDNGISKTYHVGQQVGAGETIGYMVDDSHMKLSIDYNADYSNDISSGMTANVSVSSQPDLLTGIVESVESTSRTGENGEKLINVILDVENPGGLTKGTKAVATFSPGEDKDITPVSSGTFDYSRKEAVVSMRSGEIVSVGGIDGSQYAMGSVIMTLTSDDVQNDLSSAQNRVSLQQNGVASAQREVQTLQKKVNDLKQKVADANIRATMDGVVVSLDAKEGQTVKGEKTLVTIADLKNVIVNADVASSDVINVQPGQPAEMTSYLGDGSELTLTGTVASVALEPREETAQIGGTPMFPAVIEIDPVDGQSIPIGQNVEYRITTAISHNSLLVPNNAIVNTETGTAVFARPKEGEVFSDVVPLPEGSTITVPEDFVLVPVETGIADSENTEILWGINEGTSVYLPRQSIYPETEIPE